MHQVLKRVCAPFTDASHAEYGQKWPARRHIGPQASKWPFIACLLCGSCKYNAYVECTIFFWVQEPAYTKIRALCKLNGHPAISPSAMARAKATTGIKRGFKGKRNAAYQEALPSNEVLLSIRLLAASMSQGLLSRSTSMDADLSLTPILRSPGLMMLRAR